MTTQDDSQEEKAKLWAEMDAGKTTQVDPAPKEAPAKEVVQESQASSATKAADKTADDAGTATEDRYKDLPEDIRHELLGYKSLLGKATERLRTVEGRIGGLTSQVKQLTGSSQATRGTDGAAPSAAEIRDAKGNPQAIAKLQEEYPEFGAAMKSAMDEQLEPLKVQLKELAGKEKPDAVTPADLDALRRDIAVEAAHPGWQKTVKTPQFHGWLESQPDSVKALAGSDDPADAIKLLSLNSEVQPKGGQQKQERLRSAAAAPSGRASSVTRAKPVEQMTKAELWAYQDEIDRQQRA